jgi:hypothetical protein
MSGLGAKPSFCNRTLLPSPGRASLGLSHKMTLAGQARHDARDPDFGWRRPDLHGACRDRSSPSAASPAMGETMKWIIVIVTMLSDRHSHISNSMA